MVRTQIQLPERQWQALKDAAAQQKLSVAELIRRSVDAWLTGVAPVSVDERRQRTLALIGKSKSGCTDISANHDQYLEEAYRA